MQDSFHQVLYQMHLVVFLVAQNSTISVSLTDAKELCMFYMLFKEKDSLPDAEEHVCDAEGLLSLKIAILRLKQLSKSQDKLQRKYLALNDRYSNNTSNVKDAIPIVYQKILSLHQRRIEATAYTIIQMTNNLGRVACL